VALEISRVDRVQRSYPLAPLFPSLTGPFTAASIAFLPPRSTPTGSTVWTAAGVTGGAATPLLAGPDADSSGAVVVTGSADLWIKTTVGSETDAVKVERVTLLGGGAVSPVGPLPQVLSVQGRTGAVVLTNTDVGAASPTDLSTGLATKVNTSTYTAGLAAKQDAATLGAAVAADATVRAAFGPSSTPGVVTRRGGQLLLNNAPYTVVGSNVYDLLASTPTEAAQRLSELAGFGVNTVRIWAFAQDGTAGSTLLSNLDAALTAAQSLGIRLLPVLGNHWTDWGGPTTFGYTQTTWYQQIDATWGAQIDALVTRYSGNPGVFAWEILNEPRPGSDTTSMAWLGLVAARIKAHDATHLVCSGSEGFTPPYFPPADAQSGGPSNATLANLNSDANIDIASAHLYTKYLTPDYSPSISRTLAALRAVKAAADNLGKPLIIGEVGFNPADKAPGVSNRARFLSDIATDALALGVAGGFLWNWGRAPASSFTLAAGDAPSEAVVRAWAAQLRGVPVPVVSTTSVRVASSADDVLSMKNGSGARSWLTTAGDVGAGWWGSSQQGVASAIRFASVAIPAGSRITSASLVLTCDNTQAGTTVNTKIRAIAADSAIMPASGSALVGSTFTTATVNWDNIPAWQNQTVYASPDISTVVQEIVDRAGWVSGNAICMVWDDIDQRSTSTAGDVVRTAASYDNAPASAPQLLITYSS
jgi:hypothetical protein